MVSWYAGLERWGSISSLREKEGAIVVEGASEGLPEDSSVAQVEEAGRRWSDTTTVEHARIVTDGSC